MFDALLIVIPVVTTLSCAAYIRYGQRNVRRALGTLAIGFGGLGAVMVWLQFFLPKYVHVNGVAVHRGYALLLGGLAFLGIAAESLRRFLIFDTDNGLPATITDYVAEVFEQDLVLFGLNGLSFWAQSATMTVRTVEVELKGVGVVCPRVNLRLRPGQLVCVALRPWAPQAPGHTVQAGLVVTVDGGKGRRIIHHGGKGFSNAYEVGVATTAVLAGVTLLATGGAAVGTVRGKSGYWVTFASPASELPPEPVRVVWEPTPESLRRAQRSAV
jgi:hypothetical protein